MFRSPSLFLAGLLLLGGPGCDGTSDASQRQGSLAGRIFEVKKVDGVDVFVSLEDSGNQREALHSGSPRIVDGCLFVGDSLVVWPAEGGLDHAKQALTMAASGGNQRIELGGGGMSAEEGDLRLDVAGLDVRCSADEVWFAHSVSVIEGGVENRRGIDE